MNLDPLNKFTAENIYSVLPDFIMENLEPHTLNTKVNDDNLSLG
jgi:hypothetical protein